MKSSSATEEDLFYARLFRLAVLSSVLILFWGIWSAPLLSENEGRRALAVKEMLESGNWLLPTLNGSLYISKPPLFYWLAGIFAILFQSAAEWVMRLPSSLCALTLVWAVFKKVGERIGKEQALATSIILITSPLFTLHSRRAEIEMTLALLSSLAMLYFLDFLQSPDKRKSLLLSFAFLGLAFLTKGPVALLTYLLPILAYWVWKKDRSALRGLSDYRGWLTFAFLALPWFVYLFFQAGEKPIEGVIQKDIVRTTFWGDENDSWYIYPVSIVSNFLPWIIVLAHAARSRFRSLRVGRETGFFVCWALAPLAAMSLFGIKHAKYILPLYPAVAAALGIACIDFLRAAAQRFGKRAYTVALWSCALLLGGWIAYYAALEARFYHYRYAAIEPLVKKIEELKEDAPVYAFNDVDSRLVYYYGKPIPIIRPKELSARIEESGPFLLIAETGLFQKIESNRGVCRLAEIGPYFRKNRTVRLYGTKDLCE